MSPWIGQLLALSGAHPLLLGLIVFVSATAEAVIVVGALVPGTAIILAASGMAGAADLSLWPLVLWAAAGAAAGDGASYWIGHHYGRSLGQHWPLSSRPEVLEKGTSFFERHGGKSVFLGRFVPGVKAVIPAIAGMAGMAVPRFLVANLSSGIIWAAVHVLPAAAAGVLLSAVGSVSGRLLAALLGALIAVLLAFWLARLFVVRATPWVIVGYQTAIERLARSENRVLMRIARVGAPDNPKLLGAMLWSGLFILAAIGLAGVVQDIVSGDPLTRADVSISQFVQSLRTPPLDRAMVVITDFGDALVISASVGALLAGLAITRRWRSALLISLAFAFAALTTPLIKLILERPRPTDLYSGAEMFAFPSGHSVFITLLFATLALLIASRFGPRGQIATWTTATLGVIAVGLSRIYLGAHWPSDVMGGVLYGSLIGSLLALLLHYKADFGRAGVWSGILATAVFLCFGAVHVDLNVARDLVRYAPRTEPTEIGEARWLQSGWLDLPQRRVDLFGETEEPLSFQYVGPMPQLAALMQQHGWQQVVGSGPVDFLKLLSPATELSLLPPWPLLHDGKWPVVIMANVDGVTDRRHVLRFWPSKYVVTTTGGVEPLLIGSLTEEYVKHPYRALTAMYDEPAPSSAVNGIAALLGNSSTFVLQSETRASGPGVYLIRPSDAAIGVDEQP